MKKSISCHLLFRLLELELELESIGDYETVALVLTKAVDPKNKQRAVRFGKLSYVWRS